MHKLFYLAAIVFLFSCNNQKHDQDKDKDKEVAEPSKAVIDSLVKDWYAKKMKPGSPSWEVDNVTVLNMNKESQEDNVYHLTLVASGIQNPPAIPDPPAPSSFSDTVRLDLVRKGGNWEVK